MIKPSAKKKTTLTNSPVQKAKKTKSTTETSSPKITKQVKTKKVQPPKFNESTTKLTRSDSFANVLKRKGSSFFGALPEMTGRASLGILSPRRKQATTPFTSPTKNSMTSPREPKDKASFIKKLSSFKKGKENNTVTPNKSSSKTSSKESINSEEFDDDEEFKSPVKVLFSAPKGMPNLNLNKIKSTFGSTEEDDFEDEFADEPTIISIDSPKNECLTDDALKTPRDEEEDEEDVKREAEMNAIKNSFSRKISNSFKYDDDSGDSEEDEIDGALIDEFGFNVPKNFIVKKNKPKAKVQKKQNILDKLMSPRGNKNQ
eukprot:gene4063-7352_t